MLDNIVHLFSVESNAFYRTWDLRYRSQVDIILVIKSCVVIL